MDGQVQGRRGRLMAAIAGLGLLALAGASAAGAQAGYSAERFGVAERKKDQVQPRVSGAWVVWKDYRSFPERAVDGSPNGEIWARNLETGEERQVGDSDHAGDPAISGTLVAWTNGGGDVDVQMMDLGDGQVYTISDETRAKQERPAVSGALIVWQDNRGGDWDLYARDLFEIGEKTVVEHDGDQLRPAVSGQVVVWEDWRQRGPGPDVWALDLEEGQPRRLSTSGDAFEPAIAGRWVVWVGKADQGVFAHNLDDGATRRLSRAGGPKSQPAIAGDLVVWTDERNGTRDIYAYDLAAGVEFAVTRLDGDQDDPSIDGSTVVWSDSRGPNRDIFGAHLSIPWLEEAAQAP